MVTLTFDIWGDYNRWVEGLGNEAWGNFLICCGSAAIGWNRIWNANSTITWSAGYRSFRQRGWRRTRLAGGRWWSSAGLALAQEEVRDTWIWRRLLDLHDDVRYAGRVLLRSPGFTATAVVSLALGIGANTAMFSILHALVLRSLPVAEAERLVVVTRNNVSMPYPFFVHLRDQSQTLSGVLAFRTTPCRFNMGDATERITAALVSGGYFEVLGVAPAAGTTIGREDDVQPGSGGARGPVAVIGYGLWMRSFGGRSSAIGAQIRLNGQPFTVAGVAPRNFSGTEVGEAPDVYLPMTMQEAILPGLGTRYRCAAATGSESSDG